MPLASPRWIFVPSKRIVENNYLFPAKPSSENLKIKETRTTGRSVCVPALQPVDVLLPPPPAVLSRLLVADFSPNSLQDSFFSLQIKFDYITISLHTVITPSGPGNVFILWTSEKSNQTDVRCLEVQQSDLGERKVVGQRNSFLTQQLLLLLRQLEVWVQLQQQKKSQSSRSNLNARPSAGSKVRKQNSHRIIVGTRRVDEARAAVEASGRKHGQLVDDARVWKQHLRAPIIWAGQEMTSRKGYDQGVHVWNNN